MHVGGSRLYAYPRLMALHDMEPTAGRPDASAPAPLRADDPPTVCLPSPLPLSADRLAPDGAYILGV